MTYEQACRAIKQHFQQHWQNATPVVYPNKIEKIEDEPYFARLNIQPSSGRRVAVGGKEFRRVGRITVQLFALQGLGQDDLAALEEKATRIFERKKIPGLHLSGVGADRIGPDGQGYYQSNVRANFSFDA